MSLIYHHHHHPTIIRKIITYGTYAKHFQFFCFFLFFKVHIYIKIWQIENLLMLYWNWHLSSNKRKKDVRTFVLLLFFAKFTIWVLAQITIHYTHHTKIIFIYIWFRLWERDREYPRRFIKTRIEKTDNLDFPSRDSRENSISIDYHWKNVLKFTYITNRPWISFIRNLNSRFFPGFFFLQRCMFFF